MGVGVLVLVFFLVLGVFWELFVCLVWFFLGVFFLLFIF